MSARLLASSMARMLPSTICAMARIVWEGSDEDPEKSGEDEYEDRHEDEQEEDYMDEMTRKFDARTSIGTRVGRTRMTTTALARSPAECSHEEQETFAAKWALSPASIRKLISLPPDLQRAAMDQFEVAGEPEEACRSASTHQGSGSGSVRECQGPGASRTHSP